MKKLIAPTWHPIALVATFVLLNALGSGYALATEDDSPLSLTLSHDIMRDNNFEKDDANKESETVNTTTVQANLNKSYGRQTYQANLKLSKQMYDNFGYLNNDGKEFNGAFSTEFMRNWLFGANGSYASALNPVLSNVVADRVERNIRTSKDGGFSAQYGNGGTWAIAGTYDQNSLAYSADAQKYQNAKQHTVGLRAIYNSTDLLSYSLGSRRMVTKYDLNSFYTQIVDKFVDLSVSYQATGQSVFNATVSRQSTDYTLTDSILAQYGDDGLQSSKGWSGSASWSYTPHGILSYNANFQRTTGTGQSPSAISTGFFGNLPATANNNTITTGFNAGVNAQLTGKTSLSVNYAITHFQVDQVISAINGLDSIFAPSNAISSSYNHVVGLGVSYQALRSMKLGCSVQKYSQTYDQFGRLKYNGHSFDCSASFTLNPS